MFFWSPEEVRYLIELVKRYASIRLETAVFLGIGCGTRRVAYGLRHLGSEVLCLDISLIYVSIRRHVD